jgi:DNA topoisomerase-3
MGAQDAVVTNVRSKANRLTRPTPLNTVSLLRACSAVLGIGPAEAMRCAEELYIRGYITYPRTESSVYPSSFDCAAVVAQHARHEMWGSYATSLLSVGLNTALRKLLKKFECVSV